MQTFEQFAAARTAVLLRHANALTCDLDLAEDVVRDLLVRTRRRWSRLESSDALIVRVKRMVVDEYLSWRRHKAIRAVTNRFTALSTSDEDDTMLARIAALEPKQQVAVVLRYCDDSTDAEIAAALGWRPDAVPSHLSRAMTALRANDAEKAVVTLTEGR